MAGFNPKDPMHKKIALGALDHIDGQLGKFMHQTKASLSGGSTPPPPQDPAAQGVPKEGEDKTYAGHDQPGGHAGHSFGGSKDQHGSNNSHFGHSAQGGGEPDGDEGGGGDLSDFAKKTAGIGNMVSLLKR